jgi:hypothetical protein
MRCSDCGELLEYMTRIVVTRRGDGKLRAGYETEDTPGLDGQGETGREGKYHLSCYEGLRGKDPDTWPAV